MIWKYNSKENLKEIPTEDPWNNWTFRGDFNGDVNLEESRKNLNYFINLRGDKVTEEWKFRNSARMSVYSREYVSDGEIYTSDNISNYITSSVVKSLTSRWSAGAFASYYNSNYSNEELRGWARRLVNLAEQIQEMYIYFNNDIEGFSVLNAMTLHQYLTS